MIMNLKLNMFEGDLIKMIIWLEADSEAIKKDLRIGKFLSQEHWLPTKNYTGRKD